ncbi:MAG TPA: lytic transglycosylase domain-containing protein [Candidatus Xenobia bacterium]|nr:lytic transglycosylase domain-containing protein [Candidatus Xenobia bacterium]
MAIGLGLLAFAGTSPARAQQVLTLVSDNGRMVFINETDMELRAAAKKGGAAAAATLVERRKQSLADVQGHIDAVSKQHSVDPNLVRALIEVESAWNPRAVSYKGAMGLMQLMPATAAQYGVSDAFDPKQNVSAGVRHLRYLLEQFKGNTRLALAAYNAGENAVTRNGGVPPYRETQDYILKLEALYGRLGSVKLVGSTTIYRTVDKDGRVIFTNE